MHFPSLTTVIAYIRTMMGDAMPTQPAGLVLQEPMTQTGKASTASATKPRAKRKPKPKLSAAQSTTQGKSRKPAQKSAQAVRGQSGKQPATPARKTRQHAKPAAKRKP